MDLERLDRVLVVGGDEDDQRHPVPAHLLDHLEAVGAGHLNVEEHQVRGEAADGVDGLAAVAALADDLDVGLGREEAGHALARQRLVIDDQRAERLHAAPADTCGAEGSTRHGMTTRTVSPCGARQNSNR